MRCVYLVLFLIALPLLASGALSFTDREIEITAKPSDESVSFVFPFKNEGNKTVKVVDINLTCSCLSAKTEKESYAPGEAGKLEAIFAIGSFTGVQRKAMTMTSQEEGEDEVRVELLAILTIPEVITINPELVKWRVGEDPVEKVFMFKVPYINPIKIINISCSREGFDFSVIEKEEGREYEIRLKPEKTSSPMLGMLKIETDCELKKHRRKFAFFSVARKGRK